MTAGVPDIDANPAAARKRRKVERQLRALYAMRSHLNTWELVCAALTIPALAVLCLLVALKLHLFSGSTILASLGAVACGGAIWWMGRRWLAVAVLIVMAMLVVLFETVPDIPYDATDKPDRKTRRRLKLEQAIAKREALLRSLDRQG